eukprot:scaffold67270_cov15-Prasinocladus_malaysianus.AAC.1
MAGSRSDVESEQGMTRIGEAVEEANEGRTGPDRAAEQTEIVQDAPAEGSAGGSVGNGNTTLLEREKESTGDSYEVSNGQIGCNTVYTHASSQETFFGPSKASAPSALQ